MSNPNYPPSIQAAADRAIAEAFGTQDDAPPAEPTQQVDPTPPPVVNDEPTQQHQQPQNTPPTDDADDASENEQLRQELHRTLQQLNTLKGKYRSEDKARQETDDLRQQVQRLEAQLANQQQQAPRMQAPPSSNGYDPKQIFGDSYDTLAAELGEETLNHLTTGIARSMEGQFNQRLSEAVAPISDQVNRYQGESFVGAVQRGVGAEFNSIGNSEEFNAWLSMPVAEFGSYTRSDALADARKSNDVESAVAIFRAFQKTLPKKPNRSPVNAPSLEEQVLPSGRGSSVPRQTNGAIPDTKIYTGKEIASMTNQIITQQITGQAAKDLQAKIDRATQEGRIRSNE